LKTTLGHITTIQTGFFAKTVAEGEIVYLQARHFDENGQMINILHPELKADDITEKHLLRPGDVLFVAKGTKNIAAVYESHNPPAVASTSFFVLRLFKENVLPEYLAWFINHPDAQKKLKGDAIGSSMVSISKAALEKLEISIPDVQTQRAILNIMDLRNTEKKLRQQIENLRDKQIQQQIINAIK
jgi:restriction endonuclease S subunit